MSNTDRAQLAALGAALSSTTTLELAARRLSSYLATARCSHTPIDVATVQQLAAEVAALSRML